MELTKRCLIFGFLVSLLSSVDGRFLELPQARYLPSKHFVLVHGTCHGAWSYYKIVALLKSSGHNATAIDLAGSGIDPQQAKDFQTITQYHQPLMDFMAALPPHEKVILVGHSVGGLAISQAMEEFPDKILAAVFVTAAMPGPNLDVISDYEQAMEVAPPSLDNSIVFDDGFPISVTMGPLYLKSFLYQLSPIEDWVLATMLVRPFRLFSPQEMAKELLFTVKNYGQVNRVFIKTDKDMVTSRDFQEWQIENNPPNEVMYIPGSDHMVMMSKPFELASSLLEIAGRY